MGVMDVNKLMKKKISYFLAWPIITSILSDPITVNRLYMEENARDKSP
jgi:hypothetical protein